jgi:hypothetical protein
MVWGTLGRSKHAVAFLLPICTQQFDISRRDLNYFLDFYLPDDISGFARYMSSSRQTHVPVKRASTSAQDAADQCSLSQVRGVP